MRVGVLGLGFMGITHLQAWQQVPGAQVVAVMSRNAARWASDATTVQGNLGRQDSPLDFSGYRKYSSADDLLQDPQIDAVDICLPTHVHAPVAMQALQAGKHVLLEKPMALDGAAADQLCAEAQRTGKVLMVAHVLRFMAPYQALSDVLRSGKLGAIRSALFRRRTAVPEWGAWEFDRQLSGGGVYDLLIHDVDMALHLFGVPDAISSTGFENLTGGVDTVTSQFHYRHADSVVITGGWHHRGAYPFSMEYTVIGDHGVVEYSSAGRPPAVYWQNGEQELLPMPEEDAFAAELSYFAECCRTGTAPLRCPPEESALAVKAALLMSAAREQKGGKVPCHF